MLFIQFIKRYKERLKNKKRSWKDLGSRDKALFILIILLIASSIALVSLVLWNSFSKKPELYYWIIGTGSSSVVFSIICCIAINIKKNKEDVIQKYYQTRVEAVEETYTGDYRNLDYKEFLLWIRDECNKKISKKTSVLRKVSFGYVISVLASLINVFCFKDISLNFTEISQDLIDGQLASKKMLLLLVVVILFVLILFIVITFLRNQINDHYELYNDLSDVMSYYLISDYKMMNIYSISVNGESSVCTVKQVQDE